MFAAGTGATCGRVRRSSMPCSGFRATETGEGLARALCETALDVSGARGAALVRWDAEDGGRRAAATRRTAPGSSAPAPLDGASLVAEVCRAGKLQVLEDARARDARACAVRRGPGSSRSRARSRSCRSRRTAACWVRSCSRRTRFAALTHGGDVGPLTVLGAVVAGSLEMVVAVRGGGQARAHGSAHRALEPACTSASSCSAALAEADRYGHPVSLVLVDIDHFKRVNDTWGHEAGDAVLKQVARVLQDGVRVGRHLRALRRGRDRHAAARRPTASTRSRSPSGCGRGSRRSRSGTAARRFP